MRLRSSSRAAGGRESAPHTNARSRRMPILDRPRHGSNGVGLADRPQVGLEIFQLDAMAHDLHLIVDAPQAVEDAVLVEVREIAR
jgi:hypothetical protein